MCLPHNLCRILRKQRSKLGRRNGENSGTNPQPSNISHEVRLMHSLELSGVSPGQDLTPTESDCPDLCCSLSFLSILNWGFPLGPFGISNGKFFLSLNKGNINQFLSKSQSGSYCSWSSWKVRPCSLRLCSPFLFSHTQSVENFGKAGGTSESVINSQSVRSLQSSRLRM